LGVSQRFSPLKVVSPHKCCFLLHPIVLLTTGFFSSSMCLPYHPRYSIPSNTNTRLLLCVKIFVLFSPRRSFLQRNSPNRHGQKKKQNRPHIIIVVSHKGGIIGAPPFCGPQKLMVTQMLSLAIISPRGSSQKPYYPRGASSQKIIRVTTQGKKFFSPPKIKRRSSLCLFLNPGYK